MRNKVLYILIMITTALSWSLEVGAQTTYYVYQELTENKWTSPNNIIYTLQSDKPFLQLSFDCKWSKVAPWPYYGNNKPVYVMTSNDKKNWKEILVVSIPNEDNWYNDFNVELPQDSRYIKFESRTGATGARHIRNVKVTRATTLSSSTTSLTGFRTTPNRTDEKTIMVDYNNTYSDAVLTGTCDNSNFVVVQEDMEETGSKEIKVLYQPSSVGTHSGNVTLKMGTASKNNHVTTTFTVSGTCYLTYSFSATAITNNTEFGTTQVELDGKTDSFVSTTEESSDESVSKKATFKASPVDGYNFIGWYSDNTYQNRLSTSAEYGVTLTSNTTSTSSSSSLYAKFEVDKTAAQQAITEFEETYEDLTEDTQAAIDLATAKRALEAATTIAEVNAAVAILKQFDVVTFDENIDNQIEKGNSLTTSGIASSSNGFAITYTSSDPSIIKVEDGRLVAVGVGSAIITATTHGDGHYIGTAKRSFTSFTHDKGTATITINVPATITIDDVVDNVYTLSNNTIVPIVTFSEDGVLVYEDGRITAIGAGKVTMYVSQAENDDWNPVQAEKEITVEKHANTVIWKEYPITSLMALHTIDLTGYASATSGNITYSSSNTEVITIEGNVLTAHKAGNAIITASVAASNKFSAANNTLEFTVNLVPTTIKWEQTLPALNDRGGNSVTLTASVIDNEGNTIPDALITYYSSAPNVASVSGNSLTPKGGGSATITASFAGNEVYAAAANVTKDVSVTGYSVSSAWVNDWSSAPATGSQFYLYNTTNSKFLQEGHGEESRDAFVDAENASLWTYSSSKKIESVSNSSNFIANRTNEASTDGTGNRSEYEFVGNNGKFRIRNGSGITTYDVFNNGGIFDGYNNGSGHYEWWLISEAQYDFRLTNAPKAVNDYLYDEDYATVVGPIRTTLADVCANTTSGFAAANAQIASLEQTFDDYVAAIAKINTFEAEYVSKTPDIVTPANDIAEARTALQNAANSTDIANALKKLKAFDEIVITQQPAATLPLHGETTIMATANNTINFTSNNTDIITLEGNKATAVAEGTATVTLTTVTSTTHYAAMPVTTNTITVSDALILNNTTLANYTPATYGQVTLERTFKAGYNTIALPFNTDLASLGADKAYQLSIVTYNKEDGYSLYFKEVESIVANEPYIIHATTQKKNPVFNNVEVVAAQSATITAEKGYSGYSSWSLISNYTPNLDMNGKYGVVNATPTDTNEGGCLMIGGENSTLPAFTAYITGPDNKPAKVKAAYLDDEEVDGILELLQNQGNEETQIYDLQGRQLPEAQRGVNIVRQTDGSVRKIMKR